MSWASSLMISSRQSQENNPTESQEEQAGALFRTHQYRKVMKPLLERKRRTRINRCLEELKHLIRELAYTDAESLARLEKADILELTVHHLHRHLQRSSPPTDAANPAQHQRLAMERYWSGFRQCSLEVSRVLQPYDRQLSDMFQKAIEQLMSCKPRLWRPW